jgi:hypothetical protein
MAHPLPEPPQEPSTFGELFSFYHEYVKVLYANVQTENVLPSETLFELNAALDHISHCWIYDTDEATVVHEAYGHLKRSCLDIFKLALVDAVRQYGELRKIDTSAIDNGSFDQQLNRLFSELKRGATEARRLEGDTRGDGNGPIRAFDRWQPIYAQCLRIEDEFYSHPALDWAKRRHTWKRYGALILVGVVAFTGGTVGRLSEPWIARLIDKILGTN